MDKFAFLQEISTISKDPSVNQNNFEIAMNFSDSIDLFYAAILAITESTGGKGEIHIVPRDFSSFVVSPGEFAFTMKKAKLELFAFNFQNGCVNIREENGQYIASTSLY